MMRSLFLLALLAAGSASAETVVAARTISARQTIAPGDVVLVTDAAPGALARVEDAFGREVRTTLYAGRPVYPADLADPALVERNQIVSLLYDRDGLAIYTEGRALDRAAQGEIIRIMNLASKITVTGVVTGPGQVTVR